jgi:L-threonylcarbamoyladenylate synthase
MPARISEMANISSDINTAANLLTSGEVVAIPTETVYGLAGNAFNQKAVGKIFEIKDRPHFNPLILHTNSIDKIQSFAHLSGKAYKLAEKFWPGPLTLLLPKKQVISDLITAGYSTVAVRIPAHPLTLQLLDKIDFPLAAPSANPFGYVSPTMPEHVEKQLGKKISMILDGGPCKVGIESTIAGFDEDDNLIIYRLGGLEIEEIEKAAEQKAIIITEDKKLPNAPGMLKSHYATGASLAIGNITELIQINKGKNLAVLSFKTTYPEVPVSHQIALSPAGDLNEAAGNLFSAMRRLDALNPDLICAEYFPEEGLGRAINDRLRKAAYVG